MKYLFNNFIETLKRGIKMLKKLRERFNNDRGFRATIYLIALILTIFNTCVFQAYSENEDLWIAIFISGIATLCIYQIGGGIATFISITLKLSGIVNAVLAIIFLLVPWVVAWLQFACMLMTGFVCLVLAYMFPIIGVPLFRFVNVRRLNKTENGDEV